MVVALGEKHGSLSTESVSLREEARRIPEGKRRVNSRKRVCTEIQNKPPLPDHTRRGSFVNTARTYAALCSQGGGFNSGGCLMAPRTPTGQFVLMSLQRHVRPTAPLVTKHSRKHRRTN